MPINLSPETMQEYFDSAKTENRKLRVYLLGLQRMYFGVPGPAAAGFVHLQPAGEDGPMNVVPYSAIAYVENA
jgi:hypothetical protein